MIPVATLKQYHQETEKLVETDKDPLAGGPPVAAIYIARDGADRGFHVVKTRVGAHNLHHEPLFPHTTQARGSSQQHKVPNPCSSLSEAKQLMKQLARTRLSFNPKPREPCSLLNQKF